MSNKLYIIGAGEFGREVAAMLPFSNQKSHFSQTVFIDDTVCMHSTFFNKESKKDLVVSIQELTFTSYLQPSMV